MYERLDRSVVHMDLDAFFVSVERKRDSSLKGKPIIIGGSSDRGVVSSCSYEARVFGVHSAMPMHMARRLCPEALIVSGDMEAYSRESKAVTEIIADTVPVFEKSSIDEFYLDLSGMDRFFGCYKLARELRGKVMGEQGLPISFGLSVNKMVAKVATNEVKPNGQMEVPKGGEMDFLAPLPVRKLPMVGKQMTQSLSGLGIRTVQKLREVPREVLERIYGKHGSLLWKRARGLDDSPVVPYSERKSMSAERTFSQDTIDIEAVKSMLRGMTEKLAFKLRSEQKLTACVTVKLRYANFDTYTRQMHIAYTASDHPSLPKR